jgi:hypothetical protein
MLSMSSIATFCRSVYIGLGNRRHFERSPADGVAVMTFNNEYGELTRYNCRLVDISEAGIGIESSEAVALNSGVYLESEAQNVKSFAQIRYCQRRGSVYAIGLAFRPPPHVRVALPRR